MKKLYKPENEVELSLIKGLFESEGIQYFVHNDHFGSLRIGPQIDLFNAKMVMVPEDQFEDAKELVTDYLERIREEAPDNFIPQYSFTNKLRMIIETVLFGWFVPGRKGREK